MEYINAIGLLQQSVYDVLLFLVVLVAKCVTDSIMMLVITFAFCHLFSYYIQFICIKDGMVLTVTHTMLP